MTYGQMLRELNEEQRLLMLDELVHTIENNQPSDHTSDCDEKWEYAFRATTQYIKERLSDIYIDERRGEFHSTVIGEGEK